MEIWKFGGSCLRDASSYEQAAQRVGASTGVRLIVVSAMRGVTDALQALLQDPAGAPDAIVDQHRQVLVTLGGRTETFDEFVAELSRDLLSLSEDFGYGHDSVLSWGDRVSALILHEALAKQGIDSSHVDAGRLGVVTNEHHGQAQPVEDVHRRIEAGLAQNPGLIITPGFVGLSGSGKRTTLGRNSSDFTAALIAAAAGAPALRIFSSADGILSADPALVPQAHHLQELSYDEAAELIHAGAPVLHPMALATMQQAGITGQLQSLADSKAAVTSIVEVPQSKPDSFRALPHRRGLVLIEMHTLPQVEGSHLLGDCLRSLKDAGIHVDMTSASESTVHLAVADDKAIERLMAPFQSKAEISIRAGYSSVSLVGRGVTKTKGIASQALGLLAQGQVFPRLVNDHGHAPCISFLLEDASLEDAMQLLHDGIISAP